MSFEFDSAKSELNLSRHGINFIAAQALWNDPELVEISARTVGESRYLVIAKIKEKHWSGVITYRNNRTRIISVRRARKEEVQIYEAGKEQNNSG